MAFEFLTPFLTITINSRIENGVFPDNGKVATVAPLDKGKPDKNISSFRSVSLLSTPSKIYEKGPSYYKYGSLFLTYNICLLKNYCTQHVVTRLVEEWREHTDEDFVVVAVLNDLCKAFDYTAYQILIAKLMLYGFSNTALCFIYSYLKNHKTM